MDGKVGQVLDVAMPIGAAVASTYGPSYAAGARTGAAMWDKNRELYRQKKQGKRMSDLLAGVAASSADAEKALVSASQDTFEGPDGSLYATQAGQWDARLGDIENQNLAPVPEAGPIFKPKEDTNIILAREAFANGDIATGNAYMEAATQNAHDMRLSALEIAAQREAQDVRMRAEQEIAYADRVSREAIAESEDFTSRQIAEQRNTTQIDIAKANLDWQQTNAAEQNSLMRKKVNLMLRDVELAEDRQDINANMDLIEQQSKFGQAYYSQNLSTVKQLQDAMIPSRVQDPETGEMVAHPEWAKANKLLDKSTQAYGSGETMRGKMFEKYFPELVLPGPGDKDAPGEGDDAASNSDDAASNPDASPSVVFQGRPDGPPETTTREAFDATKSVGQNASMESMAKMVAETLTSFKNNGLAPASQVAGLVKLGVPEQYAVALADMPGAPSYMQIIEMVKASKGTIGTPQDFAAGPRLDALQ